nr:12687_t:CDS:2 [Entrophospora candida]
MANNNKNDKFTIPLERRVKSLDVKYFKNNQNNQNNSKKVSCNTEEVDNKLFIIKELNHPPNVDNDDEVSSIPSITSINTTSTSTSLSSSPSTSTIFEIYAQLPRRFSNEVEVLGKVGRFTIVREREDYDTTKFDQCHCIQKPCPYSLEGGRHPPPPPKLNSNVINNNKNYNYNINNNGYINNNNNNYNNLSNYLSNPISSYYDNQINIINPFLNNSNSSNSTAISSNKNLKSTFILLPPPSTLPPSL